MSSPSPQPSPTKGEGGNPIPILVLIFLLTAGFWIQVSDIPHFEVCLFKSYFHLDCPGCGMTRAFLLIPKGQWQKAWQLNAGSFILYFLFLSSLVMIVVKKIFSNLNTSRFYQIQFVLSQFLVVFLFAHWIYKLTFYFQIHSFTTYLKNLA